MTDFSLSIKVDEDDIFLFKCIAYYLVDSFDHSEEEATSLIEKYCVYRQETGPEDWLDWLHHDGPFIAACHIQYTFIDPDGEFWLYYRNQDKLRHPKSWGQVSDLIKVRDNYQPRAIIVQNTILKFSINEYEIIKSCFSHQHKFDYLFQEENLSYQNNRVELSIPSDQLIYFMYGLVDAKRDKVTTDSNDDNFGHKVDSIIDRLYTEFYR